MPGHLRLDELDTATDLRLESGDEYSTISGLILADLGRTALVGDEVHLVARRETAPDRQLRDDEDGKDGPLPSEPVDAREHHHEPEIRHLPVSVRLTVEAVERHVPSSVRVEVLDLMSDLQALDTDRAADAGTEAGR